MPPPSQQGSRGGLITTLIIFILLFAVTLIYSFYMNTQLQVKDKQIKDQKETYAMVASDTQLTEGGDASVLKALVKDKTGPTGPLTVIDAAMDQTRTLTQR